MKKLSFLTSMVALTFAVPAMAVPSNTSSTFPSNGFMEEDYTYQNQANVTNLKVSEGTATTTASYADCPTEFPNSDEGATSTDECYTACTVSDFPANSHIASVTGKNYSGANVTDTCAIESCVTGYHLNPGGPDLATIIGNTSGKAYGALRNDGNFAAPPFDSDNTAEKYGISAPNTFGVEYDNDKGMITGAGRCSTQGGTMGDTSNNITAEFGTGYYCWCQIDSYTPKNGTKQTVTGPWVFLSTYEGKVSPGNEARECASNCGQGCGSIMYGSDSSNLAFHSAMFNAIPSGDPSCDANEISITWADASAEDIAANDAGSVTYGGDIRTPKKAVHKPGKIFTGWTFNIPSGN